MSSVCTESMPECSAQILGVKERLSLKPSVCNYGSDPKSKRRSRLFPSLGKEDADTSDVGDMGIGRCIPLKQGYLYKKSSGSFSKEWKKKYVTLCTTSMITLHPSLPDYMENTHGKDIPLQCVTVKVPGQAPRGSSARTQGQKKERTSSACNCKHGSETPGTKKRNRRRTESVNGRDNCEVEPFEFQIICLNEKVRHFEAVSSA